MLIAAAMMQKANLGLPRGILNDELQTN